MKFKAVYSKILPFLIVAMFAFVGCHGRPHHSTPIIHSDNPSTYTYNAAVVVEHRPGFFSCVWHNGRLFMGTYQNYNNRMHSQLCVLNNNHVDVLRSFPGESLYNLLSYPGYIAIPVEQGALWRRNDDNTYSIIHPKHLRMGHYDFGWSKYGWITSEKDTISTDNKSQLWLNGKLLYQSSDQTWKEFVIDGDDLYCAAYFIHKRTEGGILRVTLPSGQAQVLYSQRWTACYCVAKDALGRIIYSLEHGDSSIIRTLEGPMQEIIGKVWHIRTIGNTTFMTVATHGWRLRGPSYVYVMNNETGLFEKKLEIPDAEPWDITTAGDENKYYLVTRNEKLNNLGRVYLITRTK